MSDLSDEAEVIAEATEFLRSEIERGVTGFVFLSVRQSPNTEYALRVTTSSLSVHAGDAVFHEAFSDLASQVMLAIAEKVEEPRVQ